MAPSTERGRQALLAALAAHGSNLIRDLLRPGGPRQAALRSEADAVRRETVGETVYLRALIEFSNRCEQDCLYCGLRRSRADLLRFSLRPGEIVDRALAASEAGYGTVILQSGEDPLYDRETTSDIIRRIKSGTSGLNLTLAVGQRSREDYAAWRQAGADRYLLKHETADPRLYAALRPGHHLATRLRRARWLSGLGYAVGLGNMVGLPGQTTEALVADLRLLVAFQPDMVGIGPFLPHPKTPLAGHAAGDPDLTLNFLALTRLLLPGAMLPATTALATARPGGREEALRAGANVVMVNIGTPRSRSLYEIYPGRNDGSGSWRAPATEAISADPSEAPPAGVSLIEQRRQVLAWLGRQGRVADGRPVGGDHLGGRSSG